MNQRKTAFEILKRVIMDQQYANLVMRNFSHGQVTPFVTELVYGVLRNNLYLEYQWMPYVNKVKNKHRILLNMATYEYFYLNNQDFAIVNEYVELVSTNEKKFINAILRKIVGSTFNESTDLSIKYSINEWIVNMWKAHYDHDEVMEILEASNKIPKTYYYLNTLKTNFDGLAFDYQLINKHVFTSNDNLIKTDEFKNGLFQVQDYGASRIVDYFELQDANKILDICAAPGGKTAQLAILTNDQILIQACDIHPHRIELLENKMRNMSITSVNSCVMDASKYQEALENEFDIVLADVPCSGLGVLSRRPDIKINIKPEDIDAIAEVQKNILDNASKYLKVNGQLIYSTCTLNKKENQRQIKMFLDKNHDFILELEKTIFPNQNDTDGFYLAKLIRIK